MAWKLWWLTALLAVLLASTGAAVDISIIGGSEVNIGDKAEIQCSYTDYFLYLPNFIINGVTIESTNLETQLSDYNQSHNWTCTGGCSATYNLTLSKVSRGYNGTTYQCSVGQDGSVKESGIVTLIVRGLPQTSSTTAPTIDSNKVVTNVIRSVPTSKVTPMASSSVIYSSKVVTASTSSQLSLVYTTSLGASVTQTTQPSPTTELVNRVDDDATTTAITTPVTDRVTVGGDKGAAVNISIIGGSEVNIGDKAEIQCSYTEFFLHLPNFIINGVTIESGALETQLRGYDQNHDVTCTNVCSATYTLTLSNVSRGYNGTTYQCSVGQEGAIKSGIVTLIVRDPTIGGTTAAKDTTAGTESTDAPSYVNVVVGSVTGVTVYLLTIILIGLVIHFGVKAKKNRSKGNKFPSLPPTPPPPSAPVVEMTHNLVYGGIPAPPAYVEHIDFGGNRDVLVNMDVRYHDVPGRNSVAVESLYDYVQ